MKILIIGGSGFVGSNLAFHFNHLGHKVTVMDNLVRRGSENNLPSFKSLGIEFVHGDIRNKEDFKSIKGWHDVVLLCAAQPAATNYSNPVFDINNNTVGVLNTLEFLRDVKAGGLIFWSTNKCYSGKLCNSVPVIEKDTRYIWNTESFKLKGWSNVGFNEDLDVNGGDHSIYGISKIAADLLIQEWSDAYNIPSIINRFSCLAGPNQWGKSEQGWVSWFAIANILNLPINIYGFKGKQVRDCLFTKDINLLIESQIDRLNNYRGEIFNIGGGNNTSLSLIEAIELIQEKTGNIFQNITFDDNERRADQRIYISDSRKAEVAFDWKPKVRVSEGYDQILDWVMSNKKKLEELYG